jgi:antitoxin (DNA-binding transcriptional repressor) of toxin-antitoxin stability system
MVPSPALETFVQILEVRGADNGEEVTITAAMSADAIRAMLVALSEQRDRNAQDRAEKVEDVLALREQTELVDRFDSLATGEGHAVVSLSRTELRTCVFELTRYVGRVDGEHFQPADLRARLQIIGCVSRALWEANAAAATIDDAGHTGDLGRQRDRSMPR